MSRIASLADASKMKVLRNLQYETVFSLGSVFESFFPPLCERFFLGGRLRERPAGEG